MSLVSHYDGHLDLIYSSWSNCVPQKQLLTFSMVQIQSVAPVEMKLKCMRIINNYLPQNATGIKTFTKEMIEAGADSTNQ